MALSTYLDVLRRRWWIVLVIIAADVLVSGYLYRKAARSAGWQACLTLYVGDLSASSLISVPQSELDTVGAALAGETAANFFADDVDDVAQSRSVAAYIARHLQGQHRPNSNQADFEGAISGSRLDRTSNLCVTNPNTHTALAGAEALATAMTRDRKQFFGPIASRLYTNVISAPVVGPASSGHNALNLLLRVILGILVALGAAFLWDALDPAVRNRYDVERALEVPVLTSRR